MYEEALPVPSENDEYKSDDDANGERHPKNIHQLTTQSLDYPWIHVRRTAKLYYKRRSSATSRVGKNKDSLAAHSLIGIAPTNKLGVPV